MIEKKNQILSKKEGASNRLRQNTAPGNSSDRALCLNCWTVRGTLLHFRYLSCLSRFVGWYFRGKVDSEIRGQVIRVQTQKQSFNFFLWIQLGVVLMHTNNLYFTLQCTYVMLQRSVNWKSLFFNITRYETGG